MCNYTQVGLGVISCDRRGFLLTLDSSSASFPAVTFCGSRQSTGGNNKALESIQSYSTSNPEQHVEVGLKLTGRLDGI
jgi:hypothetical protein